MRYWVWYGVRYECGFSADLVRVMVLCGTVAFGIFGIFQYICGVY